MADEGILPLDVAVIAEDLLWAAEAMNAIDRDLADVRVSDYLAAAAALDDATPGHPAVFAIGPDQTPWLVNDPAALTGGRAEIALVFTVREMPSTEADAVRSRTGEDPILVDDIDGLVHRVDELLTTQREIAALRDRARSLAGAGASEGASSVGPDGAGGLPPVPAPDRIVVVTGGSGGTGRTTVAINLAVALAADGGAVALVDAHGPVGDVPLLLGLPAPTEHDLDEFTIDESTVRRMAVHHPATGLLVVTPPTRGAGFAQLDELQLLQLLVALEPHADTVVVDAPLDLVVAAGLAPLATATLLVSTSRTTHLKNTLVAAELLERVPTLAVVLNEPSPGRRSVDPSSVEQAVGVDVQASLPFDDKLADAVDDNPPRPVAESRSKVTRGLADLAQDLRRASAAPS